MAWKIEYGAPIEKILRKLSSQESARILKILEKIAALDDPRQRGHALVGDYAGHWRYRVGDYRVIVKIEDQKLVIIVIAIGHRREVYR